MHLELDETFAEPEHLMLPLQRMLCHFMIDHLPDQALSELIESMADMHDFYEHRPPALQHLPERQYLPARVVDQYERPVFQVTED